MIAILLSMIPVIGWGFGDYAASKTSKLYHPSLINLIWGVVGGAPVVIGSMIVSPPEFSLELLRNFFVVGLLVYGGFIALIQAFSEGSTGTSIVIANAYAAVSVVYSLVFLGGQLNAIQSICVAFIIGTVIFVAYDTNEEKADSARAGFSASSLWAMAAMLMFGVGFALFDVAGAESATWYQDAALFNIASIPTVFALYFFWGKHTSLRPAIAAAGKHRILLYGAVAALSGTAGLFWAVSVADGGSIPVAVSASSALVTGYLAHYIDGENLHMRQRIGAVVIVASLALLALQAS